MIHHEKMPRARESVKFAMAMQFAEAAEAGLLVPHEGLVLIDLIDGMSGAILEHREIQNIVTLDAGILSARLYKNSQEPNPGQHNGLTMLAVGTGATGNILSPDAPQESQRALNQEIARKAFLSTQFRTEAGVAVAYPTNILDLTTQFGEAEAVGPLNEMALVSAYSNNPAVTNPINNGPDNYDPTIDVSKKDLLANYLTFSVMSKPSTAIFRLTWRMTF